MDRARLFYNFADSLLTIIHYKFLQGPFHVHETLHSPNIMNPFIYALVICISGAFLRSTLTSSP